MGGECFDDFKRLRKDRELGEIAGPLWAPLTVAKKAFAALPAGLLTARPKRLRFLIFNTPGRLLHHKRKIVLRLATTAARLAERL